ncbi:ribonuclease domain-containing protein [Actinocorallia sp. A-T 12471]|uniref:ribonuclease domain-containing protein n=1 Tax=Actinocorallia sp. A-T 12471 TaxID=3089813 RepID=UPI0029CD9BC5|nr:ribonuclease domain-containing protein [Actinocorallia sp. A-T 12471]MDX6742718.1 ribonuclease domain-containing protein [Actinocorallia sp. A-T 12471]
MIKAMRVVLPVLLALTAPACGTHSATVRTAVETTAYPSIAFADLPKAAQKTLTLIAAGGPFPYRRDGSVFLNRERLLPANPRGYYREFTVATPGREGRGPRRIIVGEGGERYYSPDHYRTFLRITG